MATPQNPPPATVPNKVIIKKLKNAQVDIDVSAEVIADGTTNDSSIKGRTTFDPKGAIPDGKGGTVFFQTPGMSWEKKGGLEVVTKLSGPVLIKGTITIQTIYGPDADATMTSGYGRGTTPEDEKAGDTSLGFHESCHRRDFLDYLNGTPLPVFGGKVGIARTLYNQAATAFATAMQKYFTDMDATSTRRTDDVGYTITMYNTNGPRP